MGEFGLTNDDKEYREVVDFRDAAIADNWAHHATYGNEAEDRASRLSKDGFTMKVLTRSRDNEVLDPKSGYHHSIHGKWKYEAQVSIWGPDRLAINVTPPYNWEQIKAGLRRCHACQAEDVDTQRYSFAGRCCANCRPEMAKQHEKPGWCD